MRVFHDTLNVTVKRKNNISKKKNGGRAINVVKVYVTVFSLSVSVMWGLICHWLNTFAVS